MIYKFVNPYSEDFTVEAETLAEAEAAAALMRRGVEVERDASLRAAFLILKNDVPDAWKDSQNAQQRIAWACKRLFVEGRREFTKG
jgi:hypothetical protein